MIATISRVKSHFANWREWEFNPIVIKELRQGVRSLTVAGMLMLLLIILFVTSIVFLVTESFNPNLNMEMGATMFSSFMVILAGASIFFIPLYTGVRVAAERQENNPDLLYVTTLSPTRIILGKFLCSAYITLLFFSACMPFMAFTNLLRGVDLPTVFFELGFLFLVVCMVNMGAIFLACLPVSRPFKFLFVLYGIGQSITIITSLTAISFEMMRSGVGAMMAQRDFWIGTLTLLGLGLAVTGLLFVLSAALISPLSANRALAVRIYLTVFWLLGGGIALAWVIQTGDFERILGWTYPTYVVIMLALLVVISNSDSLSQRVRRTIPRSPAKRFLALFFFNGAAGGLLWAAGIVLATYLATQTVAAYFPAKMATTSGSDGRLAFIIVVAYAFAYALAALFIQRRFLSRRPPKLAGLLAVLLPAGWALAPSIFLFFANRLSWRSVDGLQLGNIFNVMGSHGDQDLIYHLYFACGWVLVVLVLNAKWFGQQLRNFVPPPNPAPPPAPTALPPVITQ